MEIVIAVGLAGVLGFLLKIQKDLVQIHFLVNSRFEEAVNRVSQLEESLLQAGAYLPPSPPRRTE